MEYDLTLPLFVYASALTVRCLAGQFVFSKMRSSVKPEMQNQSQEAGTSSATSARYSTTAETMEHDSQPAGASGVRTVKRRNVDVEGNEIPDSKRNKAVPEVEKKHNALLFILHAHEWLMKDFDVKDRGDIDAVADITSVVVTSHNYNRQMANGVGGLRELITADFVFTANGINVPGGRVTTGLKNLAERYGFKYTRNEDDRKNIGTLSSILSLVGGYRHRLSEVRLGNVVIMKTKRGNEELTMELSRFGLNNTHAPFLTGCSYTPSLQSSMKQSLGPLTVLINLTLNTEEKYARAWKDAFCQAFKLVPNIEEMANLLAGSRARYSSLIRALGDLCHFGITRSSNKAFIPAAMLLRVNTTHCPVYKARFENTLSDYSFTLGVENLGAPLLNLDFSGHGLLYFWNQAASERFTMRGDNENMSEETAAQINFHSVMGSQKENLDLLDWMTGAKFQTRREMGNCFARKGESGKHVAFNPIPFLRFAKLASAAQTDFIRGGKGQVSRAPVFSGRCRVEVDADSELFRILKTSQETMGSFGLMTDDRAIAIINGVKATINTRISADKMIGYGTTSFYLPCNNTQGKEYGDAVEVPKMMKPRYFYQQD